MYYKLIAEILEEVANAKTIEDKVKILKSNDTIALKEVLRFLYDSRIKVYTSTPPKYVPDFSPVGLSFSSLHNEHKTLYIFEDSYAVKPERKDQLLIQKLESMHPLDSELLYSRFNNNVDKKISKKVINEAFPGLVA